MDLNYLLARHQTSLMRARTAACASSRAVHRDLAIAYGERITVMQHRSGAEARVLSTGQGEHRWA